MCFHLFIVTVVFGEFAVFVHQIICYHKELQLFIDRINNQMLRFTGLCQSGTGCVDKSNDPGAQLVDMIHQLHHFLGIAGNGRIDHH